MPDNKKESVVPNSRLLIDVNELSGMLKLSPRTIWRQLAAGKMLKPVRIGGSTRWRLRDVIEWEEAGCPEIESGQNAAGGNNQWRPSAN